MARALAEDTGADPDDLTPHIAAAMIMAATWLVEQITRRKLAGETLTEMRDQVYAAAGRAFDLLESGLGDYATRPVPADHDMRTAIDSD